MRAARLHEVGRPVTIDDVPEPSAGPGTVLVRVMHCGVCASDLHVAHGATPAGTLPQILGHEPAGRVAAGAEGFAEGEWVAVMPGIWCGECGPCRAGMENRCVRGRFLGVDVDGAWAELIAVPARGLLRIPQGVDPVQAAIATDAGATAFHALHRAGVEGRRVAIYGAGGVGAHGIVLARALGASWIAAVDTDPVARERALALGADLAVDPSDGKPGRAVRAASEGGVDAALEFIGNAEAMSQATKSLRTGGRAVFVGLTPDELHLLPAAAFVASELEVLGSFGATRAEVEELLAMLGRGEVDLGPLVTHRLPLEDAPRALEMLATREDHPLRIVLDV